LKKISRPFFLPGTKKRFFWYVLFALIFLLYHDFWAWGKFEPLIGSWLPFWFLYLMALIVAYSIIAFLFTRTHWPQPPPDLVQPPPQKKSGVKE